MLNIVDFVSIGSNDLVQYLMAADRDNPKVNHLCQPLSPPVLRVLQHVIQTCNRLDVPVTLCGEMAGQPQAFLLLLGMGLQQFSMSPAFVTGMKKLASVSTLADTRRILERVLQLKTTAEIRRIMTSKIKELAPDFAILDTA